MVEKSKWCAVNFRFLSVTDVKSSMAPMDGVLGLAPDDPSNGPSFIATLFNQGTIDKKMLGLMLTQSSSGQISSIVLGGYDNT
jgi:acetamidase/formamidase